MIRLRALLYEQIPALFSNNSAINLSKGPLTRGISNLKTPNDGVDSGYEIQNVTGSSKSRVAATFRQARKLQKPATTSSQQKARDFNAAITGIGNNSKVIALLRGVRDMQELSEIIASYHKLYSTTLWDDVQAEWGLPWTKLWDAIKHINPNPDVEASKGYL